MFRKMKRMISVFMVALMMLSFTACSSNAKEEPSSESVVEEAQEEGSESTAASEPEETSEEMTSESESAAEEPSSETEEVAEVVQEPVPEAHSEVLVAYFSATGTTKGVAERIAAVTGGDLYEILAAEPYTADDLNYNDRNSRSTKEQNDKSVRPEIGSEEISLEGYTTIYLGFPIWWGEEPRILDTFVEKYSFEGITVIPFCTSGGSGIGRSGPNMEALAGTGTWLEGERFSGSVSEEDLQIWIESLK